MQWIKVATPETVLKLFSSNTAEWPVKHETSSFQKFWTYTIITCEFSNCASQILGSQDNRRILLRIGDLKMRLFYQSYLFLYRILKMTPLKRSLYMF